MTKVSTVFGATFGSPQIDSGSGAPEGAPNPDKTGADPANGGVEPVVVVDKTTSGSPEPEPGGTPLVVGEHRVEVATLTSNAIEVVDENNTPIQLQLDAEGNAYDAEGILRYTADDIAALESNFNIDSVVNDSPFKIIIDGKPKSYANTIEGFRERESDIAASAASEARKTVLSKFFEQHPDLYQAYEYKSRTGTIDGFKPAVDYSKIVLDANNVEQCTNIIREGEIRAGRSIEMANSYIDFITKDNKLFEVAKQYQANIVAQDQASITAREESRRAAMIAEQEANTKFLGVIEDEHGNIKPIDAPGSLYDIVVNKRMIGGVSIPAEGVTYIEGGVKKTITPVDIFNTIALSATPEGHTKYQQLLHEANNDPAKMANLAFILLSGSSFKGLVDAKANTTTVIKRLNAKGASVHSGGTASSSTNSRKLKAGERVGW